MLLSIGDVAVRIFAVGNALSFKSRHKSYYVIFSGVVQHADALKPNFVG